jgi:hypothetical protein
MSIKFPPIFTTSTPAETWVKRFTSYAFATVLKDSQYLHALKALLDDNALEKFDPVTLTNDEAKDLKVIAAKFINCFEPITLEAQLRYEFQQRKQLRNFGSLLATITKNG